MKAAHESKARREASRYASAIRALRVERGIKQTEVSGLSEREVRRIESGETVPHIESLRKLAAAHEMIVDEYMAVLAPLNNATPPLVSKRSLVPLIPDSLLLGEWIAAPRQLASEVSLVRR